MLIAAHAGFGLPEAARSDAGCSWFFSGAPASCSNGFCRSLQISELNGVFNSSRKQSLFHHDFLVPSSSGACLSLLFSRSFFQDRASSSGACPCSFPLFLFSGKDSVLRFWCLSPFVLRKGGLFHHVAAGVLVLVTLLFCPFFSQEKGSVPSFFSGSPGSGWSSGACLPSFLVLLLSGATNQWIFDYTWVSLKCGLLLFGVYAGVIYIVVPTGKLPYLPLWCYSGSMMYEWHHCGPAVLRRWLQRFQQKIHCSQHTRRTLFQDDMSCGWQHSVYETDQRESIKSTVVNLKDWGAA